MIAQKVLLFVCFFGVALCSSSYQYGGKVRLVSNIDGKQSPLDHGILQVLYTKNGVDTWGTVCIDNFNSNAANIACRGVGTYFQAGGFLAIGNDQYNPTAPILLDELNCASTDPMLTLDGCSHNPVGVTDCTHSKDVYLYCIPPTTYLYNPNATAGAAVAEGYVKSTRAGEYNHDGFVCAVPWSADADGQVICRQLGTNGLLSASIDKVGFAGISSQYVAFGDLSCRGDEPSVAVCRTAQYDTFNGCVKSTNTNYGYLYVKCIPSTPFPTPSPSPTPGSPTPTPSPSAANLPVPPLRFISPNVTGSTSEGWVEAYVNGRWGTFCVDNSNANYVPNAGAVVCRQMGFSGVVSSNIGVGLPGSSSPIWGYVRCGGGNEANVNYCARDNNFYQTCYYVQTSYYFGNLYVKCVANAPSPSSTPAPSVYVNGLRLTNFYNLPAEGWVEVYNKGRWGSVCASTGQNYWIPNAASVVCRQLGFTGSVGGVIDTGYPGVPLPGYDELSCSYGNEANVLGCRRAELTPQTTTCNSANHGYLYVRCKKSYVAPSKLVEERSASYIEGLSRNMVVIPSLIAAAMLIVAAVVVVIRRRRTGLDINRSIPLAESE